MSAVEVVGKGLYSLAFASRLIHASPNTLRRWAHGYPYTYRGETRTSSPRWQIQHGEKSGVLGFLDLIEAKVILEFQRLGVSWPSLAAASQEAKRILGVTHPFATLRLQTNGQRIFLEVGQMTGDPKLIEVAHNQQVFEPIIKPFLVALDFGEDLLANRWWPIGRERDVIVDPTRAFGNPIVKGPAVPTAILARAAAAEKSIERVARWYQVSEKAVTDAVEFERTLVAA